MILSLQRARCAIGSYSPRTHRSFIDCSFLIGQEAVSPLLLLRLAAERQFALPRSARSTTFLCVVALSASTVLSTFSLHVRVCRFGEGELLPLQRFGPVVTERLRVKRKCEHDRLNGATYCTCARMYMCGVGQIRYHVHRRPG